MLLIENQNAVRHIVLARSEVHNAFNDALVAELTTAFQAAAEDESVRVLVLSGQGKHFSAGADLEWMKAMGQASPEQNRADAKKLSDLFEAIAFNPKPVVARVQGAALGGGAGLVAACDIAFCLPDSLLGFTEVRLGIMPAVIGPHVLRRIGSSACRRYLLTGERFDGHAAEKMGLVHGVCDDEASLDEAIDHIVQELLKAAPGSIKATKAMIHALPTIDWPQGKNLVIEHITERRMSAEGQEGMAAFLEKRKPSWVEQG